MSLPLLFVCETLSFTTSAYALAQDSSYHDTSPVSVPLQCPHLVSGLLNLLVANCSAALAQVVPGAGITMYSQERLLALLERLTAEAAAQGP